MTEETLARNQTCQTARHTLFLTFPLGIPAGRKNYAGSSQIFDDRDTFRTRGEHVIHLKEHNLGVASTALVTCPRAG